MFRKLATLAVATLIPRSLYGKDRPAPATTAHAALSQAASKPETSGDYSQEAYIFEKLATVYHFENDGRGFRIHTGRCRVQSEAALQSLGQLVFAYSASTERMTIDYVRVVEGVADSADLEQRRLPVGGRERLARPRAQVRGIRGGDDDRGPEQSAGGSSDRARARTSAIRWPPTGTRSAGCTSKGESRRGGEVHPNLVGNRAGRRSRGSPGADLSETGNEGSCRRDVRGSHVGRGPGSGDTGATGCTGRRETGGRARGLHRKYNACSTGSGSGSNPEHRGRRLGAIRAGRRLANRRCPTPCAVRRARRAKEAEDARRGRAAGGFG